MKIDLLGGYSSEISRSNVPTSTGKAEASSDKYIDQSIGRLKTGKSDKTYIDEAIKKLKHAGDIFNRRLDFKVDEATKMIVVKVIDTETDKVIKEIPPEQLVRLAAKIQEMIGLLVDEER